MDVIRSAGVKSVDLLNMHASQSFKEMGESYHALRGAAMIEDKDGKTGEVKLYAYLFTEDGVYAGNAENIRVSVDMLLNAADAGELNVSDYSVRLHVRKSSAGKDFFTLEFLEADEIK